MKSFRATIRHCGTIAGDSIGARIFAIRKNNGLTQKAFAEKTGLSPAQVGRLERGGQGTRTDQPSIDTIAREFGVQPVWLYAGSEAPPRMWPQWWKP